MAISLSIQIANKEIDMAIQKLIDQLVHKKNIKSEYILCDNLSAHTRNTKNVECANF